MGNPSLQMAPLTIVQFTLDKSDTRQMTREVPLKGMRWSVTDRFCELLSCHQPGQNHPECLPQPVLHKHKMQSSLWVSVPRARGLGLCDAQPSSQGLGQPPPWEEVAPMEGDRWFFTGLQVGAWASWAQGLDWESVELGEGRWGPNRQTTGAQALSGLPLSCCFSVLV